MMKKILMLFPVLFIQPVQCESVSKNNTLAYLRIFGRGALTGFAQGTINGTCKTFPHQWHKRETEIRSATWLVAVGSETALHWKNKDYPTEKLAVGFFGLGVGQVAGEMVAALRTPDHVMQYTDVLNVHFAVAGICALYSIIEKKHWARSAQVIAPHAQQK